MPLLLATASVDCRPRLPSLLVKKLKARANQTGYSLAQLVRYYILLGMRLEESLPSIMPNLGNISFHTPVTSRKTCVRIYLDSDLVPSMNETPEALDSVSNFVNIAIRNELLKRKNKNGGD